MSTEQIIWFAGAAIAMTFLLKMMRDRQIALNALIRASVEEKLSWAKKKAKAAKLARKTARKKAAEEKVVNELFSPESTPTADQQAAAASSPPQEEAVKSAA